MKQIKIIDQDTSESFTFYDNANGTILRSFDGFEYPEVLASIEDVAGKGGAHYINSKFGRRRMSFQGDLVGDKFTQRRELLTVARQRGTMKLFEVTTYDDLLLRFEAEIIRLTMPYTHQIHSFLFELQSPDWRLFSQAEEEETVTVGGLDTITNNGTELTDVIFTITGPGTSINIENLSSGESFSIDDLIADDEVIIDTLNKTVTKNGDNSYSIFTGDFFGLQPGDNTIVFNVSGSTGATSLILTYRHAYNGI
ncbi:MAG: Phage tail protein [bacterium ADurb.Bin212]|nr:MAG: Phage tail protein [bacterium ADurb.Bin212]